MRKRRFRNAAEWSELVARWRASGETSKEFAAQHGLKAGTLLWWSSRLSKQSAGAARRRTRGTHATFKEVVVTGLPTQAAGGRGRMEVVTRGGRVIRWDGSVDVGTLREVLQAVESC